MTGCFNVTTSCLLFTVELPTDRPSPIILSASRSCHHERRQTPRPVAACCGFLVGQVWCLLVGGVLQECLSSPLNDLLTVHRSGIWDAWLPLRQIRHPAETTDRFFLSSFISPLHTFWAHFEQRRDSVSAPDIVPDSRGIAGPRWRFALSERSCFSVVSLQMLRYEMMIIWSQMLPVKSSIFNQWKMLWAANKHVGYHCQYVEQEINIIGWKRIVQVHHFLCSWAWVQRVSDGLHLQNTI